MTPSAVHVARRGLGVGYVLVSMYTTGKRGNSWCLMTPFNMKRGTTMPSSHASCSSSTSGTPI